MSRRGHFDSGHGRRDFSKEPLDPRYHKVVESDPNDPFDEDEYLMSFVECDNCGEDTHMDDAMIVSPTQKDRQESSAVTNYYCGPVCRDLHQTGPRKGMIGNPFGQTGIDPSQIGNIFKRNN